LGVLVGLHVVFQEGLTGDATFLGATVGAAVASWIGVLHRPRAGRLPWVLIAAGVTLSAMGDSLEKLLKWLDGTTPDASVADVGWLLSYFAIAAGLVLVEMRSRRARADVDGLIDATAIGAVALLLVWQVSLRETLADQSLSPLVQAVWTAYPLLDVVLLTLVVRTLISKRTRTPTALLLASGTACWLGSDFAYVLFGVAEGFSVWLDIGWMIGAALLSAAIWPPAGDRDQRAATAELSEDQLSAVRLGFGISLLLAPQLLAFAVYVAGDESNPVPLMATTMILAGLAFARTLRLLRAKDAVRARLASSEKYYRALAANSSDAVTVLDADGRIVTDSPALAPMLGYEGQSLSGDRVHWAACLADCDAADALFDRALQAPGDVLDAELRARHEGESEIWLEVRMVNLLADPDVEGVVVNLHDITERKQAEDALLYQALHDGLTGLANRGLFHDRVEHALQRSARSANGPAIIYIDLDGFKNVNDSLGHETGDQLLLEVATRLSRVVRSGDTVARLGGDEFAILVENQDDAVDEAIKVAERVRDALTEPVQLRDRLFSISASLGIADREDGESSSLMLRNADIAMYQAKARGRGCWVVFDPSMWTAAVERLQLESELVRALETRSDWPANPS
jgi:diguanylate cyclase (GGDEF)-like protein/PAS domain S-box-containing protein